MATERLYYDDSYTTRFQAPIVRRDALEGRPAVELAATYFYPESGGQEADRGALGPWSVIDVRAGEDGSVWHVIAPADHGAPEDRAAAGERPQIGRSGDAPGPARPGD